MSTRVLMVEALKSVVIPRLQEAGFKGSFPHLRRFHPDRIDIITFQFNRWGGSFVIELGQCDSNGITHPVHVPPDKVKTAHLSISKRVRIPLCSGDCWFHYENATTYDEAKLVAQSVVPHIEQMMRIFNESLFPDERAIKAFRETRIRHAIRRILATIAFKKHLRD